ncbi:polysaccharide pyruvyl transferase family protein [Microbacterium esteraromaticum]|uniref:polysaccharide pyruvyl transferase family protein n=1 Tax=Microbacterium esteraromaticum TaxID=57043 RepID=UPI003C3047DE
MGGTSHLANFSLMETPPRDAVRILRTLDARVRVSVRDRLSKVRAERLLGRVVEAAPDVAQYLQPSWSDGPLRARELVDLLRARGPVVALVPNAHYGALFGANERIALAFRALVPTLIDRGYSVLVLAHDLRSSPDDPSLMNMMVKDQDPSLVRSFLPRTAAQAKAVLGLVDGVITGRMHAAVAAMSQDIPTVGLDYVDKFVGQFEWFGRESAVVPWQSLFEPAALVEMLQSSMATEIQTADAAKALLPRWLV